MRRKRGVSLDGHFLAALDALPELYATTTLRELPARMIGFISQAMPCEMVTYDEWELDQHGAVRAYHVHQSPPSTDLDAVLPALANHLHEHPLYDALKKRKQTPAKISDYASQSAFRRSAIYNEVYRRLTLDHQMAWFLPESERARICLVLSRKGRDFGEVDRTLVASLSPHLRQIHTNVRVLEMLRGRVELASHGLSGNGLLPIYLDHAGRPGALSAHAVGCLRTFFPELGARGNWPDSLERWVRNQLASRVDPLPKAQPYTPLIVNRGRDTLRVDLYDDGAGGRLLLLSRSRSAPEPHEALAWFSARFRLTSRESEVLAHVVRGLGNKAIASTLGCVVRTVEAHVTSILKKSRLERRSELIAAVLGAGGGAAKRVAERSPDHSPRDA